MTTATLTSVLVLFIALLVLLLAPWIVERVSADDESDSTFKFRVNAVRGLAILGVALWGYYHFYFPEDRGLVQSQALNTLSDSVPIKILSILVLLYLGYVSANLIGEFIKRRYGRRYSLANQERVADTYTSRALSIFISVFIAIIVLISVIRIAGFDSLLEAGGVLGFIGVFLALTQGAWAPDIISGLIILNSKMLEERDVVKLSDGNDTLLATVFRTRAFHTELLNITDNHRVMIRNSRIRDYTVHNLSRFATARGIRETLRFKIGYDVSEKRVRAMFEEAFVAAVADDDIHLEGQYPLEVRVYDTGDHAIEWSVHYYTKEASALIKTSQLFRQKILAASIEHDIALSTPITHQAVSGTQDLPPHVPT